MNTPWIKGEPKEWEAGDYFLVTVSGDPALLLADENHLHYVDEYAEPVAVCYDSITAHMPITPYTELN